jgi:hypothetical protein
MNGKRCFECLGLSEDADDLAVRKRFKELAKIYHPDRNKDPGAAQKFMEIRTACDRILSGQARKEISDGQANEQIEQTEAQEENETDEEDEWTTYRRRAWEMHRKKKEKESDELAQWYIDLRHGWRLFHFRLVGAICFLFLIVSISELFLPTQIQEEVAMEFSQEEYRSMGRNHVSLLVTHSGKKLFMNNFNTSYLNKYPNFELVCSYVFKHPIHAIVSDEQTKQIVPIHFTVYWAQFILYPLMILPIFFLFYRRNDAAFIMGNFFSRFVVGGLIILFLLTEDRWLHLISLGEL